MAKAHLYIFSDASPSDWLVAGQEEVWHTIVNFVFQSDPDLEPLLEQGKSHDELLSLDIKFHQLVGVIQSYLPFRRMQKWKSGDRYRFGFCKAFSAIVGAFEPMVSACSFREKALRASKGAILNAYNQHIGGFEGKEIGFYEYVDAKGRCQMRHQFVNMRGIQKIEGPENQMLVLLLMAWFVADQYIFYRNDIVASRKYGFDTLGVTIVSDKLSGDDDFRIKNEQNLRNLIDPGAEGSPIVLTRSPESDTHPGDLLADNLAGWLNAAITDPSSELALHARDLEASGVWKGWFELIPSSPRIVLRPAISRLKSLF